MNKKNSTNTMDLYFPGLDSQLLQAFHQHLVDAAEHSGKAQNLTKKNHKTEESERARDRAERTDKLNMGRNALNKFREAKATAAATTPADEMESERARDRAERTDKLNMERNVLNKFREAKAKAARDTKAMVAAAPADEMEYPDSYVVMVDVPGLKSGGMKVQVEEESILVISGERKRDHAEEVKYVTKERRVGKFIRKFMLPEYSNTDAVSAVCKDGVLTVTVQKLPLPEPKKSKIIQVQVA